MIRYAEAVFNGHPDKFCDILADQIIEIAYLADSEAYGQIEVSIWSDIVWLSGGVVTRKPMPMSVEQIVRETGDRIGYTPENYIDAGKYRVQNEICFQVGDPALYTTHVNDQSIVVGWAGYDEKTRYLPPEQFLVHTFRQAITTSLESGVLSGQGPDGKMLIRIREDHDRWHLEHILITLQQKAETSLLDLAVHISSVMQKAYLILKKMDSRWTQKWEDVELLINPNGPLLNGGSDGDNGQTGRKLVMDYYGPRIPIGGGALSGKDMSHIDRLGAYAARCAALKIVRSGANSCQVIVAYAPNRNEPLDIMYDIEGKGRPVPSDFFQHDRMRNHFSAYKEIGNLGMGIHFFDSSLPWNQPLE
jgi:S-adenosylmethionine synthetase